MIPELRNLPYLRRLEELKLWTLEKRRTRADPIEVYKIIRGISSVSFDTLFEFHQYGQTRGHSFKLMKKRASTELRHHFFSERVINTWNSLDNRTVISESLNIFKRNLERVRQSRGIGLFIGSWCFLTYRGWACPPVRPRPVSYFNFCVTAVWSLVTGQPSRYHVTID